MALSQHFPGLMVVPWYNKAEWTTVKDAICEIDNKRFALERLEVWKKRTPLLPCGVEGTLELLHAFSLELNESIPDYIRISLKGTAIMRFLNVCVAGRSKQGTFQKHARDVGIPDYVINIRHIVAHESGDRPGEYLLDKGLEDCYKYVIKNYWEPQEKLLEDYIYRTPNDAQMHVYCEIFYLKSFNNYDILNDIFNVNPCLLQWCVFAKVYFSGDMNVMDYLNSVYVKLRDCVSTAKIPSRIFSGSATENCQDDEIIVKQNLTSKSINDWKNLLLLYGSTSFSLFRLIKHLVKTALEGLENSETSSLVASVWLAEIFTNLLQIKNKQEKLNTLSLNVKSLDKVIVKLKKLQGNILNQSRPCTINFLKPFLLLLDFPKPYIDWKEQLVTTEDSSLLEMPEPLRKFEEDFVKNLPEMNLTIQEEYLEPPKDVFEVKIDSRWSRADPRMIGHLRHKNSMVTPYMYHDY